MARLIIKEVATKQGLNQTQLQKMSGVTAQLLSRYWNNNVQRIELEQLVKIARALHVEPGDLIVPEEGDLSGPLEPAA
jgi:DNA-binding Xre family transcriptional regulator